MHIAVFYQHYNNPDCPSTARFYSFFRRWVPRHQISLIASSAHRLRRLTHAFEWVPPGVDLHQLDVPYENAMDARSRLWAFAHYAARAFFVGLRIPRPDIIVGISTPLTAALAAAAVARLRGVPWVFVVQDLWPDFPIQMGAVPQPWLRRMLYALERRLYRSATHVIAFSPDMAAHIQGKDVPPEHLTMQFNGTDFDLIDACTDADVTALREAWDLEDKRVVLYAGTFGRANDIQTLLRTAARLRHRDDVRLVFVGDGFHAPEVREMATHVPTVVAVPPQPRHQAFAWFKLANVSLVSFLDLPVLAANSPAKFFDSLGTGTPVIVTNPGWTKEFVETHECGWYVPASDPGALADRLESVLSDPARLAAAGRRGAEVARQQFDREGLAQRTVHILTEAARSTVPL